jgi:hypothetical protein
MSRVRTPWKSAEVLFRPWIIKRENQYWFSIVDATGTRICDFFPVASGGRGWDATLEIAGQIIRWSRGPDQLDGDSK